MATPAQWSLAIASPINAIDQWISQPSTTSFCPLLDKHNPLKIGEDMSTQIGKDEENKFCLHNLPNRNGEFIVQGFRTIVFIFIVIFTTFRPMCPPALFWCLSKSGAYTELRTASFI